MRTLKLTGILASSLIFTTPQVMASPLKMSLNERTAFELKDTVDYSNFSENPTAASPRSISATANQAIICHTGGTPSATTQMQIHDPNDSAAAALGVLAFSQSIDGDLISVTTDNVTRCVTEDGFSGGSDLIFFSGFESATTPSQDLSVAFKDLSDSVTKNSEFTYKYRITNNSSVEKTFDFVDYFTKQAAVTGASGAITDPYIISPGTWNCQATGGDSCGTAAPNGTAAVELKGATLTAGSNLTVEVTRTTSNHTGTVDLLAAIFANDDDETDNKVYKALGVVDNMPPTITRIGLQNRQMFEDDPARPLILEFDVSDANGISSVEFEADGTVFPAGPEDATYVSGDTYQISLTPKLNKNSSTGISIKVSATDSLGATRTENELFIVKVTPVNDEPVIDVEDIIVVNYNQLSGPPYNIDCSSSRATVNLENCVNISSYGPGEDDQGPHADGGYTVTEVEEDENNLAKHIIANNIDNTGPDIYVDDNGVIHPNLTGRAGAAEITLKFRDNGGIANGGNDTSDPKTFLLKVIKDVSITKKAYIGSDIGGSCNDDNVAVSDLNSVPTGSTVTFCYIVTNNRSSGLLTVNSITDNDWSASTSSTSNPIKRMNDNGLNPNIPAGGTVYFYYEKEITATDAGDYYQAEVEVSEMGTSISHSASNNRFEPVKITVN